MLALRVSALWRALITLPLWPAKWLALRASGTKALATLRAALAEIRELEVKCLALLLTPLLFEFRAFLPEIGDFGPYHILALLHLFFLPINL